MMLFCTTNFQFVLPKHCVFRKISSDKTAYTQNCVSPELNRVMLRRVITSRPVRSSAILRRTRPNAICIIARRVTIITQFIC